MEEKINRIRAWASKHPGNHRAKDILALCDYVDSQKWLLSEQCRINSKLSRLLTWAYEHGVCDPRCCGDDCLCDEIGKVVGHT